MKLTLEEKLENVKRHLFDDVPIWEIKKALNKSVGFLWGQIGPNTEIQ